MAVSTAPPPTRPSILEEKAAPGAISLPDLMAEEEARTEKFGDCPKVSCGLTVQA